MPLSFTFLQTAMCSISPGSRLRKPNYIIPQRWSAFSKITRRHERRHFRRHGVAKLDLFASQIRDHFLDLLGRQTFAALEENPIDVFMILSRSRHFRHSVANEPEIEIDRHRVFRVIVVTMLGE